MREEIKVPPSERSRRNLCQAQRITPDVPCIKPDFTITESSTGMIQPCSIQSKKSHGELLHWTSQPPTC
ncbi:hypothetical protein PGT21_028000 [Puccinia graminis f. sp. tritici]|uniref:Uncharacterized protein n=1 Tax=Puccinia graminis f. sp. tritici TaxID=56615 RepID=A0A5B0PE48_PUCGR|nr:hypothetical protein PGT21_028000 [Puccinia graminis f. sp. tritici]